MIQRDRSARHYWRPAVAWVSGVQFVNANGGEICVVLAVIRMFQALAAAARCGGRRLAAG
ncbi:hypothetical protein HPP92_003932 [Vanilla planifolia]|uniref:Uncharacterized protein n=1 Tax=Vanilla planifolia TaxID=51239 RepID=A0A835VNR0_VANPL|nr:hypothetical protein HPP92_004348 [Vanilla planifolia]KAG0503860.1 hypothetical protein HPP92_003932 [Vanilla planifolia]